MSECALKTLACRGLRVGPSKVWPNLACKYWYQEVSEYSFVCGSVESPNFRWIPS